MAKSKYKGKLSKPIYPGIIELAQYGNFSGWLKSSPRIRREYLDRMLLLLDYYQIDRKSKNCWFLLAFDLANNHVKGFSLKDSYRPPGRPRKTAVLDLHNHENQPKKRGRPRKYKDSDYVNLMNSVDTCKKQLKRKHRRKITDKETLTHLITQEAKKKGWSVTRTLENELHRFQKKLSAARKIIPKNTKK